MPSSKTDSSDHVALAADIVAAYVSYNSVPTGGLVDLIHTVHASSIEAWFCDRCAANPRLPCRLYRSENP